MSNIDWPKKWFESYLTDRITVMVKLGNVISNMLPITNGIPQSSPLDPLLFNVYINDNGTEIRNREIRVNYGNQHPKNTICDINKVLKTVTK